MKTYVCGGEVTKKTVLNFTDGLPFVKVTFENTQ